MSQPPDPPQHGEDDGRQQTWPFPQQPDQPWGRQPAPGYGAQYGPQYGYPPPGYPPQPYPPPGDDQQQWYGRPPYGPPTHGQQGYGQPGYGPPGYGQQPGYWQAPYGPPPWVRPGVPGAPPPKNDRNTVLALVLAGVVVLAGVAVALWLTVGRNGTSAVASSTALATTADSAAPATPSSEGAPSTTANAGGATNPGIPPATEQPTGLGDDPVENQYAQQCYAGDMASCDALYIISDQGTPYSRYADSCAGRQPEGTQKLCEETFPG